MDDVLSRKIKILKDYKDKYSDIGYIMLKAYGGAFYPLDSLAIAVLNRSMALISGFCDLIESKNFICAAPLIRLQIDNCLRFYAAFIVNDPHKFAHSVLKGEKIKNLKDKRNKRMNDRYLVKCLSKKYPWIEKVYEETSGYIHLSNKHIFNTLIKDEKNSVVIIKIGSEDESIPDEIRIEAVDAFIAITKIILEYVYGWTYTKDNPRLVEEIRKKIDENSHH